jgi:hypothetical protein
VHPQRHLLRRHRLAQLPGAPVCHRGFPTHHRYAMVPPPRSGEGSVPHSARSRKGHQSLPQRERRDRAQRGGWGNHAGEYAL